MIDTHTHLYFQDFKENIEDVIQRCQDEGVSHLVLPNVDLSTIDQMKDLNKRFPDMTSMAIGLHPTEVKDDWRRIADSMMQDLQSGQYVAVGEIGIDLYWDQTFRQQQIEAFKYQMRHAEKEGKPVIIHCRNALDEVLESIKDVQPSVNLIFHSFTGSSDDVKKIRTYCDPYFGINGVVTYKNAPDLREALKEIGLNRIVLETDSPYLTPVPHRGKRNESAYLAYIRDKIAETLVIAPETVEKSTDENARSIFGI